MAERDLAEIDPARVEELTKQQGRRFGLRLWRLKNTGSEATVDAVRIMRAATARDLVIKVEGAYHGSGDGLAFSYWIDPTEAGPRERPGPVANSGGLPSGFGGAP